MIAIIDYGVGNLFSLRSSFAAIGAEAEVTSDPETIRRADRVILPGVGAFGDAADKLRETGLDKVVQEEAALCVLRDQLRSVGVVKNDLGKHVVRPPADAAVDIVLDLAGEDVRVRSLRRQDQVDPERAPLSRDQRQACLDLRHLLPGGAGFQKVVALGLLALDVRVSGTRAAEQAYHRPVQDVLRRVHRRVLLLVVCVEDRGVGKHHHRFL